ncbi:transglutaminase family protein [Euzebya tangerina]|uniref:transglutaminase family protein n=1 Tax=Euzebya tangerina TaxID=591198 RepID=UPI000E312445|nr:transglutaminase family protein [Euzebya tangerina]
MRFQVTHHTAYDYESEVSSSYGEAHLLPRELPGQRVLGAELLITPEPAERVDRADYFGNRVTHFVLQEGHRDLTVTATSTVEVRGRVAAGQHPSEQLLVAQPWEAVRDLLRDAAFATSRTGLHGVADFLLDSPQAMTTAAAAAYAWPSFEPGRPILDAVAEFSSRIHADFEFNAGATTVGTPVDEVLARRAGVCQDFAHLTIAGLRAMGLAARYVSGYLETDPPPGQPKLQGADVSHAWVSVYVPQIGWVDVDPTNDQFVTDRYITTAWGRDYGDVAPLKGVIFTEGETTSLEVSVDVRRVGGGSPLQQPVGTVGPGPAVQGAQQ